MPLNSLAAAIHSACIRDLPAITYEEEDYAEMRAYVDQLDDDHKKEFYTSKKIGGIDYIKSLKNPDTGKQYITVRSISKRPHQQNIEVNMFRQTWGSTALGFDGIGGQAFTSAYTVVITCEFTGFSAVYFGGRFAYLVPPNRANVLRAGIAEQHLPAVYDFRKVFGHTE